MDDCRKSAYLIIERQQISILVYERALVRHIYPVVWKKRQIGGLVISSLSCTVLSDEPLRKTSTVITGGVHRTAFSPYLSEQLTDINE